MSVTIPKTVFRGRKVRRAFLAFLEQWIATPQSGKRFDQFKREACSLYGLCNSWQYWLRQQPLGVQSKSPYLLNALFEANGMDARYPFNGGSNARYNRETNMLRNPRRRAFVKACIAALREELA